MQPINLKTVLKGKKGWVSVSNDCKKVIAEADSLKELLEKLRRMNNPEGSILNVGDDYSTYIG